MNDEVLHTGFDSMSHYILAISNSKKMNCIVTGGVGL